MRNLALVFAALMAGCSAMNETQCRSANWYQQGVDDALMGTRQQIELYAQQCGRYQVQPAEKDYLSGWSWGYSEYNLRVSGSRL